MTPAPMHIMVQSSFPQAMQITGLVPEFQYGVDYFFPLSLKFSAK
jgi:hypothetical protein